MSEVSAVSSSTSTDSLLSSENSNLGKEDFLKLLCAQLSNQDPLDPMSNDQFIAQMATFSQLEQMTNLNSNFESFMQGQYLANYATLMGKSVTALSADGQSTVNGIVKSVAVEDGQTVITLNNTTVPVKNVLKIEEAQSNS